MASIHRRKGGGVKKPYVVWGRYRCGQYGPATFEIAENPDAAAAMACPRALRVIVVDLDGTNRWVFDRKVDLSKGPEE